MVKDVRCNKERVYGHICHAFAKGLGEPPRQEIRLDTVLLACRYLCLLRGRSDVCGCDIGATNEDARRVEEHSELMSDSPSWFAAETTLGMTYWNMKTFGGGQTALPEYFASCGTFSHSSSSRLRIRWHTPNRWRGVKRDSVE